MTNKPAVIVTGGAGYIGSHAVLTFREAAYPVVFWTICRPGGGTPCPMTSRS